MNRIASIALALLAACSGASPTETPSPFTGPGTQAPVSLHNAGPDPLVYVAAGEGTLALLDIRPTLGRGEYDDRLVPPGVTAAVTDIIGYDPRWGVNFFLYRVDPASGEARYIASLLVTAGELKRNEGVVTVDLDRF